MVVPQSGTADQLEWERAVAERASDAGKRPNPGYRAVTASALSTAPWFARLPSGSAAQGSCEWGVGVHF